MMKNGLKIYVVQIWLILWVGLVFCVFFMVFSVEFVIVNQLENIDFWVNKEKVVVLIVELVLLLVVVDV